MHVYVCIFVWVYIYSCVCMCVFQIVCVFMQQSHLLLFFNLCFPFFTIPMATPDPLPTTQGTEPATLKRQARSLTIVPQWKHLYATELMPLVAPMLQECRGRDVPQDQNEVTFNRGPLDIIYVVFFFFFFWSFLGHT